MAGSLFYVIVIRDDVSIPCNVILNVLNASMMLVCASSASAMRLIFVPLYPLMAIGLHYACWLLRWCQQSQSSSSMLVFTSVLSTYLYTVSCFELLGFGYGWWWCGWIRVPFRFCASSLMCSTGFILILRRSVGSFIYHCNSSIVSVMLVVPCRHLHLQQLSLALLVYLCCTTWYWCSLVYLDPFSCAMLSSVMVLTLSLSSLFLLVLCCGCISSHLISSHHVALMFPIL